MLNYLWGFMLLLGVIYGAFTGRIDDVTNAVLDSSKEAVSLCITMLGIMAVWVGIMEIAKVSGLIDSISEKILLQKEARKIIEFHLTGHS